MLATTTTMVLAAQRAPEPTNVAVLARGQPELIDVYQYTQEMPGIVENTAGVAILTAVVIEPVYAQGGRKVRDVDKGINLYLNTNTDKRSALCTKTTRLARCIEDRWYKI